MMLLAAQASISAAKHLLQTINSIQFIQFIDHFYNPPL